MDAPVAYSLEELTWLKASELLDLPPTPPPKAPVFMHHSDSGSSSSAPSSSRRYAPTSKPPPRAEWIYRRPKTPTTPRHAPGTRPRPRPQTGYLPHRNYHAPTAASLARTVSSASSTRTACAALEPQPSTSSSASSSASSATGGPFWTTLLHPRARAERAVPALRTIPSTSQLSLVTPPRPTRALPRPPSVASSLSSTSSGSPVSTSSRSDSPVTPASASPSASHHTARRRPRAPLPPQPDWRSATSASCPPPARSILARTPSVSTRDSAHASAKCVTFAAAPTVHYARPGLWDPFALPAVGGAAADGYGYGYGYAFAEGETMGIDVDGMDVDADPFANYQARAVHSLDPARLRGGGLSASPSLRTRKPQHTSESPPPAARRLRRLMSLSRAAEPTTRAGSATATFVPSSSSFVSDATAYLPNSTDSATIQTQTQSDTPTRARPSISAPYALGARPPASRSAASLRSAASMESVRSARSAAARSVRSVRSEAGAGSLRAWLGRALGWGLGDAEE